VKRSLKLKKGLIRFILEPFIRLIFRSCKIEVEGLEDFIIHNQQDPGLLATWHEHLLIIPFLLSGMLRSLNFSALISKSRDGELIESMRLNLPNTDSIRVAHNNKHASIRAILEALKKKRIVVITPDGPQGPWRVLKKGVLQTSYMAKADIWSLSWQASKDFKLPSPDKMKLPLPFQNIVIRLVRLNYPKSHEEIDEVASKLKNSLDF
jgi:lysophospholipid acyltransferase (LPLAT)-like uncharacterized protein